MTSGISSGTSSAIRNAEALLTTSAPAAANAGSTSRAIAASSAENAIVTGGPGSVAVRVRSATDPGSEIASRQWTLSPKRWPIRPAEAVTWTTSNQGWSASKARNFWPTVPVAPRIATGRRGMRQ